MVSQRIIRVAYPALEARESQQSRSIRIFLSPGGMVLSGREVNRIQNQRDIPRG